MIISLLIPTFQRVDDLARCLSAVEKLDRHPDEVLITVRDIDTATQNFLAVYRTDVFPLRSVIVWEPGVVAAMQKGIEQAKGEIIAFIDDDTVPYSDWLSRIETWFTNGDSKIAGVGGRDWQVNEPGSQPVIGKLQWFGRLIGNHHLGAGPPREVDFIKGANCAYRAAPVKEIGFDRRLWGKGAQVHWELSLGLALQRKGWKLIYDPAVAMDHLIGIRVGGDTHNRGIYFFEGQYHAIHNETLVLLEHMHPVQRIVFFIWAFLVGTGGDPGLLQVGRLLLRRDPHTFARFRGMYKGRLAGLHTFRTQR